MSVTVTSFQWRVLRQHAAFLHKSIYKHLEYLFRQKGMSSWSKRQKGTTISPYFCVWCLVLICSLSAARSKTALSAFSLTVQRKTWLQPLWHFFLKQCNWWNSALHLFTLKQKNSTHHTQIISCPFVYFRRFATFPNQILPRQAFIQILSLIHHN